MIYEVEGDILLTSAQAIAHGIAANDPMNQGLALSLHEQYPSMHKDFHHWCHQAHPKTGEAWIWGGAGGVRVINLITQEGGYGTGAHPGKATEADVNHALRALKKIISKEKLTSIALPRLATGVGGLNWDKVKPLIESQLGELDIPIYVYTSFVSGQKADEVGS
ncbi:MAG: Appr-1-p processing protein [SAR86 cluster bacterium]|uniref:Appr-1-p processing protein n=1 Tax=SAR86 cluster bacterium TaxID=2030880 RepID=A0A2A5AY84_9GAMM|nr:MAG: Appr-1-p processing protein [SAR86 cluster bacterium]